MTKDDLIAAIKQMNIMELADLVKALEDEFGISATPVVQATAGVFPGVDVQVMPPEDEQTEFAVTIQSAGPQKVQVIKAVREIVSLGLRDAKELVESAPSLVKEGIDRDEADNIKAKLEGVGAVVEVA